MRFTAGRAEVSPIRARRLMKCDFSRAGLRKLHPAKHDLPGDQSQQLHEHLITNLLRLGLEPSLTSDIV